MLQFTPIALTVIPRIRAGNRFGVVPASGVQAGDLVVTKRHWSAFLEPISKRDSNERA